MNKLILVALFATTAFAKPLQESLETVNKILPTELERQQNAAAKYGFSTYVSDHINDLMQERVEVRDGLTTRGMYAYSDGFFKRVFHYESDVNGFRITSSEATPLPQNGPHIDPNGEAVVSITAHGKNIAYRLKNVPANNLRSAHVEAEIVAPNSIQVPKL